MQGQPVAEQVMQWMVDVSGLPVSLIGKLYHMKSVSAHGWAGESAGADTPPIIEGSESAAP
jgi:hypothetical protein